MTTDQPAGEPGPTSSTPEDSWAALFARMCQAVAAMTTERQLEVNAAMERGHFRIVARTLDPSDPTALRYVPQVLIPDHAAMTLTWTDVCEIPWAELPLITAEVMREHASGLAQAEMGITPASMHYGFPSS